jgi:hypothetical protein
MQLGEKGVSTSNLSRAHNVSQPRPISSRRTDSRHGLSNPTKSSLSAPGRSAVPAGMQGRSLPTSPVQQTRGGGTVVSEWERADLPAAHRRAEPVSSDSDSDAQGCNGDALTEQRPVDAAERCDGGRGGDKPRLGLSGGSGGGGDGVWVGSVWGVVEGLGGARGEGGRGLVGLSNLGNTCFLNAVLQCLSHTAPLTALALSPAWDREANPAAPSAALVRDYAALVRDLWCPTGPPGRRGVSISPGALKTQISKWARQFSG